MHDIYTVTQVIDSIVYVNKKLPDYIIGWHGELEILEVESDTSFWTTQESITKLGLGPGVKISIRNFPAQINPQKALRYNDGKPQWSLVHFESLEPMVRVLEFGAQKYEKNNWMKPMEKDKILDSLMRHLAKLIDGEENDQESGLPHIGHIMCNAMFYSYHSQNK